MALAVATGVIYYLMPAAPPLIAGILLRPSDQRSAVAVVTAIGAGIVVSVAVAAALAGLGQPRDDVPWAVAVLSVGATLGTVIVRWRASVTNRG